jgi:hypothetical protein
VDDLVQFLRDRYSEDEAATKALLDDTRPGRIARWEFCEDGAIRDKGARNTLRVKFTWRPEAVHIVRHDPARVLADVEAKRRIVGLAAGMLAAAKGDSEVDHYGGLSAAEDTLSLLALPYADHPDYREDWRP